jgi:DNA-binding PadR family transcriptional regulator
MSSAWNMTLTMYRYCHESEEELMNLIRQREHPAPGPRHYHFHHPRRRGATALTTEEPTHGRRRYGGRRRRRAPRGDVRTAVLLLVAEQPMHGYELMQAIAERTGGAWTPSPGAVYPTINQLEDEGLVTITAAAGRKLVTLTDAGREQLAEHRQAWGDPFAGFDPAAPEANLHRLVHDLVEATRQVARAGTDTQQAAAAKVLTDARRSLYLLLADDPGSSDA